MLELFKGVAFACLVEDLGVNIVLRYTVFVFGFATEGDALPRGWSLACVGSVDVWNVFCWEDEKHVAWEGLVLNFFELNFYQKFKNYFSNLIFSNNFTKHKIV